MHVAGQGSMIINGQRVEGRTLSFGDEGVKVSNGEEEQVVVPNEFEFAESFAADTPEVEEIFTPNGKITIHNKIYKKKSNKKLFIAIGAGICVGIAIGGVIFYRKKCK